MSRFERDKAKLKAQQQLHNRNNNNNTNQQRDDHDDEEEEFSAVVSVDDDDVCIVQELLERYKRMGKHGTRIMTSHYAQMEALNKIKSQLPSPSDQIVSLDELTELMTTSFSSLPRRPLVDEYKLIVALGGDDFFKLVASRLYDDYDDRYNNKHNNTNNKLILGVNSDPSTSVGNLLPTVADEFNKTLCALENGQYHIEQWTRINIAVDNINYGPALNDVFLGQCDSRQMSKHQLVWKGEKVLQKGSGLLVCTGTGSTGWFTSAGLYLDNINNNNNTNKRNNINNANDNDNNNNNTAITATTTNTRSFSKSDQMLKFILREPVPVLKKVVSYNNNVQNNNNNDNMMGIDQNNNASNNNCGNIVTTTIQQQLPELVEGTIQTGDEEKLRIVSLNDDDGIVSRDSMDHIPFPRGSVAEISIHPSSLSVVIPTTTTKD